jgi:AcrR family transcriptional regulator
MPTAQATRPYRGVSASDRATARRAALVDAAIACLAETGLSGVSVRSVCARARLTARYFYAAFTDLDDLLVAALASVVTQVEAASVRALEAVPAHDTAAQVRAAIDAGFGVVAADSGKANVLLVAAAGHGGLRARRQQFVEDFANVVIESLPVLRALPAEQRRDARVVVLFLMGGSTELIEAVLAGRVRMSQRALVDRLTALWLPALASLG